MSPALPLLLAVALGAQGRVETGIRLEARGRHLIPAPTPVERDSIDLTANPNLTLGVTGLLGSLSATYFPSVTASDVGPDLRWEHMHEGEIRAQLGRGPVWNLEAFSSGGHGRTDLITENRIAGVGGTGTGTNTIPTASTVDLMRLRNGLSFRLAPSRRTEILLSGAVYEDGGTNAPSQAVLPVVRGSEATAELRWRETRLDQLGLRAMAAQSRIADRHVDAEWASALAIWRRHASSTLDIWVGGGAVALHSRVLTNAQLPDGGRETKVRYGPAGELGLVKIARPEPVAEDDQAAAGQGQGATARPPRRRDVTGQLLATLGASADRLTGLATPQLEVRGEIRLPVSVSVAMVGSGTGTLSWPETGRTRRGQAEIRASFQLWPRTFLDLGTYGSWQQSDALGVPDLYEYGAFVRMALAAPPLTF